MKLSIIIVNFNASVVLKDCLQSIKDSLKNTLSYEVFVVDNASSDDSVAMVRKYFTQDVELIASKENLGFSRGNNVAVKKAKGDYILFLNPDTVINKEAIESVIDFMDKTPIAGAATCLLRLTDGSLDDGAHRGFPTPWNSFCYFTGISKVFPKSKLLNGYNMGWCAMDRIHEIDALVGAFMMVRREAGEQVGWWDEDYFFYGEDLDFCYMLGKKHWNIYFIPSVEILHYKGVSGGIKKHSAEMTVASKETKKRATLERFRAMKLFYSKHYMKKYPRLVTFIVFAGIDFKLARTLQSQQ